LASFFGALALAWAPLVALGDDDPSLRFNEKASEIFSDFRGLVGNSSRIVGRKTLF